MLCSLQEKSDDSGEDEAAEDSMSAYLPFLIIDYHVVWFSHVLAVEFLRNLFSRNLGIGTPDKVLDELTLEGVAQYIKSGKCEILLFH